MVNYGLYACAIPAVVFIVLAVVFHLEKGQATSLIAGFNALPKAERDLYDLDRIARHERNQYVMWAAVLIVGALACAFICRWIFIVAYIVLACVIVAGLFARRKGYEVYKK